MANRTKKQKKAERALEDARAELADLQEQYAKVQLKGREQIERTAREAEEKLARVARKIDRQTERVARAEERVRSNSTPNTSETADVIEFLVVEHIADLIQHDIAEDAVAQPDSLPETPAASEDVGEYAATEQTAEQQEPPEDYSSPVAHSEEQVLSIPVPEPPEMAASALETPEVAASVLETSEVPAGVFEQQVADEALLEAETSEAAATVIEHTIVQEEYAVTDQPEIADVAAPESGHEVSEETAEQPETPVAAADAIELEVTDEFNEQPETTVAAAAIIEPSIAGWAEVQPQTPEVAPVQGQPQEPEAAPVQVQPEIPEAAPVNEHEDAHEEHVLPVFLVETPDEFAHEDPPPEENIALVIPAEDRPTPHFDRPEERILSFWVPETPDPAAGMVEQSGADSAPQQPEMPEWATTGDEFYVADQPIDLPVVPEAPGRPFEHELAERVGEQPESSIETPGDTPPEPPSD